MLISGQSPPSRCLMCLVGARLVCWRKWALLRPIHVACSNRNCTTIRRSDLFRRVLYRLEVWDEDRRILDEHQGDLRSH
jgi:hypothetical protein